MKQTNENIIVQLATPERKFVKVYHDFLQNELLTVEEKMVFIALKSFVDFSKDNGGTQGKAYPTMDTVCKLSSLSRPRATRAINKLIEKKIVTKIRRGLTKSNIYILSDYATMWACDNIEEITAIADNKGIKPLTLIEHIAELEKMGYKVEIKEKEPEALQAVQSNNDSNSQLNTNNQYDNTTNSVENQDLERYTLDQIKQLFDYGIMIKENPNLQQDIDTIINILHTTMNTTKSTIRIAGQDKPAMVVISKLMKLDKNSILYVIEKYQEQTEKIKNPTAYMLTILYNAPEQYHLDMKNKISNETAKVDCDPEDINNPDKEQSNKSNFHNFTQRVYDYETLEANLLKNQDNQEDDQKDFEELLKNFRK